MEGFLSSRYLISQWIGEPRSPLKHTHLLTFCEQPTRFKASPDGPDRKSLKPNWETVPAHLTPIRKLQTLMFCECQNHLKANVSLKCWKPFWKAGEFSVWQDRFRIVRFTIYWHAKKVEALKVSYSDSCDIGPNRTQCDAMPAKIWSPLIQRSSASVSHYGVFADSPPPFTLTSKKYRKLLTQEGLKQN